MEAQESRENPEPLDDASVQRIVEQLFHNERLRAYAILDGASVPELLAMLAKAHPEHECLIRGKNPEDLMKAAPYLVTLKRDSEFTDWVLREGWGRHWGVFAVSAADFRTVSRQVRSLMQVRSPEGKIVFFRFYDPRVLRAYLPTCDSREIASVFGPILWYAAEDKDGSEMLRFRVSSDRPTRESFFVRAKAKPPRA